MKKNKQQFTQTGSMQGQPGQRKYTPAELKQLERGKSLFQSIIDGANLAGLLVPARKSK
jgi:hypothetical protein